MENTSRISLKYLLHVIALRRWVALAIAVPMFALLVIYVRSLRPAYTSSAVVLLAPIDQALAQSSDRGAMTDPVFIRSETAIMASDQLSRGVVERLQLSTVPEFQPQAGVLQRLGLKAKHTDAGLLSSQEQLLDHVTEYYKSHLSVSNDGRSKTVEVSYTAADPRLAATVANAHAEAYLQEQTTRRSGAQQQAIDWLAHEVDVRAGEVRDADAQVQAYQLRSGIVSAQNTTMADQRLTQISTQLGDARRQLSMQSALLDEVRQIRAGGDAGSAAGLLPDEALKSLLQSRVQKEAEISALDKRLAANHPTLIKARQELASVNKVLDTQLQRLEGEATSNASSWQKQVDDLSRAMSSATTNKSDQDRVAAGLPALASAAQVKRTVFEAVLGRYQTLLAERGFVFPAAILVSRAVPSARPSFPKTSLLLLVAAMASLVTGAAAAIAVQLRRSASLGVTAVADTLGLRPLVSIPRFRNASRVKGVTRMDGDSRLFIESIRFLRNAILERQREGESVTCLVTSVLPRQGKSLVAMSLARAAARAGRRTLFVELDLRRPTGSSLARRTPPPRGVGAVLLDEARLEKVVVRDDAPGLDMLLAEQDASRALDRLTPPTLRALLARLREEYEVIVIDSPPVGIVSDALTLTPLVDETILVAKDGDASLEELRRGTRLLQDRAARVTGLVLTSVDPKTMSSVDRKTLHRYVMGVPAALPLPRPAGA